MPDNDPHSPGTTPGAALDAFLTEGRRFVDATVGAVVGAFTPADKPDEPVGCDLRLRIVLSTEVSDNLAPEDIDVAKCRNCGKEYDVQVVVTPHRD